jgi:hypothetical protein
LRRVFNRFRRYDISLNPKKYVFAVDEGTLLGFIVSKNGMKIEPERNDTIEKIIVPDWFQNVRQEWLQDPKISSIIHQLQHNSTASPGYYWHNS